MGPNTGTDIPSVSFRLDCNEAAIAGIDALASSAVQELQLDPALRTRLRLIIEEMLTNVIMHGEPPADSAAELAMTRPDDATLVLAWTDPGKPFDPRTELPEDARDEELEDRPIGGLGWPLILGYCRIQHYVRENHRNKLTMVMDI